MLTLLALACGARPCPEGQVRDQGECTTSTASDPVAAGDAWQPGPGSSWQWQLSGTVEPSQVPQVDMIDVDLFDVPIDTKAALQDQGKVLICSFSAGSWEDWRADAALFPDAAIGDRLQGWAGERWLDIMDPTVRELMLARLDQARDQGCDGVEPDNVDGYDNRTGFPLNATEQLDYNRFLADAAHSRGLSVGLKNDLGQLEELQPWFDWGLNEECAAYDECDRLKVFTDQGQAVFHVEYVHDWADAAAKAAEVCDIASWTETLIKTWDLGDEWLPCG